jgi:CDP-diacylglycerol--serine O-phosphatidyltransferase
VNRIAILPTLLTLGNGVCGFAAIAAASKIAPTPPLAPLLDSEIANWFFLSACFIFAAMVFDVLDGYVARLSRTSSEFGGQLDSLCDVISFGVAPAFLILRLGNDWGREGTTSVMAGLNADMVRRLIAVIAAFYLVCTILRLARFNTENNPDPAAHKRFKGLPSPAAAGCIASLAILRAELPMSWERIDENLVRTFVQVWAPLGGLIVALLMVSSVSFVHFNRMLVRRRDFGFLVGIVVLGAVVVLIRELALFVLFWGYALNAPLRSFFSSRAVAVKPQQNAGPPVT